MKNIKTVLWFGSPREDGHTARLVRAFLDHLEGDVHVVDAYKRGISPCVDCRFCIGRRGCSISDDMEQIYGHIEACDNVVIASPVFFSELAGPLLSAASRLQTYYCSRRFRGEEPMPRVKRGGILLTAGGDGSPERAAGTAKTLLKHMRAIELRPAVISRRTDLVPAGEDEEALNGARELARWMSEERT